MGWISAIMSFFVAAYIIIGNKLEIRQQKTENEIVMAALARLDSASENFSIRKEGDRLYIRVGKGSNDSGSVWVGIQPDGTSHLSGSGRGVKVFGLADTISHPTYTWVEKRERK